MSEFCPEHIPSGVDDFTKGYFAAAEWLLDEDVNRDKLRGWHKESLKRGKADCEKFQQENAALLDIYREDMGDLREYSADERAGHDFWLSRNGHGSGFCDRDTDVADDLEEACDKWSSCELDVYRNLIHFI